VIGVRQLFLQIAVLLVLGGLAVRVLPVLQGRKLGVDAYYHLLLAEKIRKMGKLPESANSFVVHGPYSYPPAFHLVLSFIAGRAPEWFIRSFSAFIDVAHGIVVFAFAWSLFGQVVGVAALIAYLFTPICVLESLSLTPRPLGSLLISCTQFCLALALVSGQWIPFIVSASLFYALTLLTHRMATQTLFSVLVAQAAILGAICGFINATALIFIALMGSALAFILSKGHYGHVLAEHLGYLKFHRSRGSLYGGVKKFGSVSKTFGVNNPWLILGCLNFASMWILPFAPSVARSTFVSDNQVVLVFVVWAFVSVAMACFWRYGDAERHVFYSAAPTAILIGLAYEQYHSQLSIILYGSFLVYCGVIIALSLRRLSRPFVLEEDMLACFKDLSLPPPKIVMTLPMDYSYAAAYWTNQKIAAGDASLKGLEFGFEVLRTALRTVESFAKILAELNVTHLVVEGENDLVSRLRGTGLLEEGLRRGDFAVYRVRHSLG
jgi:hypothetical protein